MSVNVCKPRSLTHNCACLSSPLSAKEQGDHVQWLHQQFEERQPLTASGQTVIVLQPGQETYWNGFACHRTDIWTRLALQKLSDASLISNAVPPSENMHIKRFVLPTFI